MTGQKEEKKEKEKEEKKKTPAKKNLHGYTRGSRDKYEVCLDPSKGLPSSLKDINIRY